MDKVMRAGWKYEGPGKCGELFADGRKAPGMNPCELQAEWVVLGVLYCRAHAEEATGIFLPESLTA